MPINDYPEKTIRRQIINKIAPSIKSRRSPHQKGYIYIEGKVEAKVKIPNEHPRVMKQSKSKYIASGLKLSDEEFNDLIDCPMSGPQYYEILSSKV